ncbi:hypothetical protein FHS24_000357 [Psychrobacter luti]|uniref:Uncharacterized protein n=1 Tax=Psychrobacter luti TaxID=198481 RepID=A0A839TBP4_9GAMM|nr:hypothetical protein [Psychrobacter luti]
MTNINNDDTLNPLLKYMPVCDFKYDKDTNLLNIERNKIRRPFRLARILVS